MCGGSIFYLTFFTCSLDKGPFFSEGKENSRDQFLFNGITFFYFHLLCVFASYVECQAYTFLLLFFIFVSCLTFMD